MGKLKSPYLGPCVSTVCEVVTDVTALTAPLASTFTRFRLEVDAVKSRVSGLYKQIAEDGIIGILLVPCDDRSVCLTSLASSDVSVWADATVPPSDGDIQESDVDDVAAVGAPVVLTELGCDESGGVRIAYAVRDDVNEVTVRVNVAGCHGIAGSPWVFRRSVAMPVSA